MHYHYIAKGRYCGDLSTRKRVDYHHQEVSYIDIRKIYMSMIFKETSEIALFHSGIYSEKTQRVFSSQC